VIYARILHDLVGCVTAFGVFRDKHCYSMFIAPKFM